MRHSFWFLAGYCWLASGLWAAPVYNYTATSASLTGFGPNEFDLRVSAPGFSIPDVGSYCFCGPLKLSIGDTIPLTGGWPIEGGYALVDFGGITEQVSVGPGGGLGGGVEITASENSFVLPPNPDPSYTFAARITGQFTASAIYVCGTDSKPPCDASAVLSIELPGTLTIQLSHSVPQAPYELTRMDFTSVPEPSSMGLWLLGAGIGGTAWLARRRRACS